MSWHYLAGVEWNEDAGALTIDGYPLAAKRSMRPEALLCLEGRRIGYDRCLDIDPPPLYRSASKSGRAMRTGTDYAMTVDRLAAKRRTAGDALSPAVTHTALAARS